MALLQASPCPCPPSIMADCILSTMLHVEVFLSCMHSALRLSIAHSTWHRKWETECVLRVWDLISVLGKVTLSRCIYALWPQMTPQSDTYHWYLMLGLPWFPSASRLFSDYSTSLGAQFVATPSCWVGATPQRPHPFLLNWTLLGHRLPCCWAWEALGAMHTLAVDSVHLVPPCVVMRAKDDVLSELSRVNQ